MNNHIWTLISLVLLVTTLTIDTCKGDIIMMNGNGMPSIIDQDNGPDVIMIPSMGGLIMNDDLVL